MKTIAEISKKGFDRMMEKYSPEELGKLSDEEEKKLCDKIFAEVALEEGLSQKDIDSMLGLANVLSTALEKDDVKT